MDSGGRSKREKKRIALGRWKEFSHYLISLRLIF